jgi:hypothetical protein
MRDKWAAYNCLEENGYVHCSVNHYRNLVKTTKKMCYHHFFDVKLLFLLDDFLSKKLIFIKTPILQFTRIFFFKFIVKLH